MNSSTSHISFGACGTDMSIVIKCVHFFAIASDYYSVCRAIFFIFTGKLVNEVEFGV